MNLKSIFVALLLAMVGAQAWAQTPAVWGGRDSMGLSNSCLDAWDGPAEGKEVVAAPCWDTPNQRFIINGFTKVLNSASDGKLAISIGDLCAVPNAQATRLVLVKCSTSAIKWDHPLGLNRLVWDGKCMDINLSEGNDARRPVGLWACQEASGNQRWGWRGALQRGDVPLQWR